MTKFLYCLLFAMFAKAGFAQELNCEVKVTYENVQQADLSIFNNLESKIFSFLNDTKWTNEKFEDQERIQCSFYLDILSEESQNTYKAMATIKSTRPVYNSTYNTVLLDVIDTDFIFEFDPFTVLEYRQGEFSNNLTASLAFYAYTIIGLDYDSFKINGGNPYHDKAEDIVMQASTSNYPGWNQSNTNNKGQVSKYWINNNLTDPRYNTFRSLFYDYHRKALDNLYETPRDSWSTITNVMLKMDRFYKQNRNLAVVYIFFDAKAQEIVDIMQKASPAQKQKVAEMAQNIDPINTKIYKSLTK